jgi:hypothetical protein
MTAPNLYNITTVTGKTAAFQVTTARATMLTNPVDSGLSIKINTLFVTNVSSSDASGTFTVDFYRNAVSTKIANKTVVEPGNTVVVMAKDTSIYLEEGDSLGIIGTTNNTMHALLTYEIVA